MSVEEWQSFVLKWLARREPQSGRYIQALVQKTGYLKTEEEFNELSGLAVNIWNNTPQPDRGGKSANQLMAPYVRRDADFNP